MRILFFYKKETFTPRRDNVFPIEENRARSKKRPDPFWVLSALLAACRLKR